MINIIETILRNMGYRKIFDVSYNELDKSKTEKCVETSSPSGICESVVEYSIVLHEQETIIFPWALYIEYSWFFETTNPPNYCYQLIEITGESDQFKDTLYKLESEGCWYV